MEPAQSVKKSARPHRLNRFQESVTCEYPQVVREEYLNEDGWPAFDDNLIFGFKDSKYERITLQVGTRIIRYGHEAGHYASSAGTSFSRLALPYKIGTCIYNEYEVVREGIVVEKIEVNYGIVAQQPRWPSEAGGGEQYHFPDETKGVLYYVGRGLRRLEVSEWTEILPEDLTHA